MGCAGVCTHASGKTLEIDLRQMRRNGVDKEG